MLLLMQERIHFQTNQKSEIQLMRDMLWLEIFYLHPRSNFFEMEIIFKFNREAMPLHFWGLWDMIRAMIVVLVRWQKSKQDFNVLAYSSFAGIYLNARLCSLLRFENDFCTDFLSVPRHSDKIWWIFATLAKFRKTLAILWRLIFCWSKFKT